MLDGQGAVGLIAGYPRYRGARLPSLVRQGKYLDAWRFQRSATSYHSSIRASYLLMTAGAAILPPTWQTLGRRVSGNDGVARCLEQNWFTDRGVTVEAALRSSGINVLRDQLVQSVSKTL